MNSVHLIDAKLVQAEKLLNTAGIDCWITFVRESTINGDPILDYLLGKDVTWHSAFIITARGQRIAIVGKFDRQAVVDTGAYDDVIGFVEGIGKPFLEVMQKLNPSSIGLNYSTGSEICDGLTHGMYLTMMDLLSKIGLENCVVSAEAICGGLRELKTAPEIALIQQAIDHTEAIFDEVAGYIAPGKSEKQIAAFIANAFARRDLQPAWEPQTCPAVFTGPDITDPHYPPTDRIVESGHVLNMDFGVRVGDYCSDMQRTFYVCRPGETEPPEPVRHGFRTIVEAIEKSRLALKPGVIGLDIDKIARDVVTNAGYPEFAHGLGHQVGRFVHDGTALLGPAWEKYAHKPFQKIQEGMVFTIEPRLMVAGHGVVTIEEMVLVEAGGSRFLSTPQQQLILIR